MSRFWVIACVLLAGCIEAKHQPPIPRPKAYPRAALYPAEYSVYALPSAPGELAVNSSAAVTSPKSGWFDIAYPAYGITVNCTLTEVSAETLAGVLENRRERMARNLEGSHGEVAQWSGVTVIVAPTALRTPVQFLATDSMSYVLSGVAVSNYPADTSPDSIAPYVEAVAEDITHMLKLL